MRTTVTVNFLGGRVRDSSMFEEKKHPRAENGEFGKGAGAAKPAKLAKPAVPAKPAESTAAPKKGHLIIKNSNGATVAEGTSAELSKKHDVSVYPFNKKEIDQRGWTNISFNHPLGGKRGGALYAHTPESAAKRDVEVAQLAKAQAEEKAKAVKAKAVPEKAKTPAAGGVTEEHEEAATNYTLGGFSVNASLRRGIAPSNKKSADPDSDADQTQAQMVHQLDDLISRSRLEKPTTLYRTTSASVLKSLKPGDAFVDPGFTSTTLNEEYARHFGTDKENNVKSPVLMKINAPKGANVADIRKYSGAQGREEEHLLARNARLVFKGKQGDHYVFDLAEPTK